MKTKRIKIEFALKPKNGYPPVGIERVWASPTAVERQYVIENIPFFAREATLGDIVLVRRLGTRLRFRSVVSHAANSLIRVVVFEESQMASIRLVLSSLGCSTEQLKSPPLIAVDVPVTVPLAPIQTYLADLEARELASYEEPILRHP